MNSDTIFRRLKIRYFIAFFTLAVLSIFAYLNLYYLISSQYVFSEIINKSGKQRMLSQRIALLSHQFDGSERSWHREYGQKFLDAVDLFATDHAFLMEQKMNQELHTIYFDRRLDQRIRDFTALARKFHAHPSRSLVDGLFQHSQMLLPDLDHAVNEYQMLDEEMTARLKLIETLILISAIATLILEALFIFYPSLKELRNSAKKDKIILENSKYAFMNEFFRSIAHQWRQPLTAISLQFENILELFRFGELTQEEVEKICKMGKEQVLQLDSTIRQATDVTLSKEHRPFNILTAIGHAVQVVRSGIDIRLHGEAYTLHGDINGFTQVILTLLSNSLEAIHERLENTPGLKGVIDIHIEQEDTMLEIRIVDNGTGIPQKHIKRIFEPYYTTKFQSADKGLSLYVAKKIIEESFGGELTAESSGNSTTMHIRIPVV